MSYLLMIFLVSLGFFHWNTSQMSSFVFLNSNAQLKIFCLKKLSNYKLIGGEEFTSYEFKTFLKNNGIVHRISCPYTSEQNSIVERKHHHVVEYGLALLAHSQLPNKYWVDAFHTAIYLINRLPIPTLNNNISYTKLFNAELDCSILIVFGCVCYPFL